MVAPKLSAMSLRAAAIAGVLSAACGDDVSVPTELDASAPSDAEAPAVRFELGKGQDAFEPLADGEELPIFAGPQGGHHVYVSMRVQGIGPERVVVRSTTAIGDDPALVLEWGSRVTFRSELPADRGEALDAGVDPNAHHVYTGWPAQLIDAPQHVGERARVEVTLEDDRDRRARAARTIVIGALTQP